MSRPNKCNGGRSPSWLVVPVARHGSRVLDVQVVAAAAPLDRQALRLVVSPDGTVRVRKAIAYADPDSTVQRVLWVAGTGAAVEAARRWARSPAAADYLDVTPVGE